MRVKLSAEFLAATIIVGFGLGLLWLMEQMHAITWAPW